MSGYNWIKEYRKIQELLRGASFICQPCRQRDGQVEAKLVFWPDQANFNINDFTEFNPEEVLIQVERQVCRVVGTLPKINLFLQKVREVK